MSESGKRVPKQTDKARAAFMEKLAQSKRRREDFMNESDESDNDPSTVAKKQRHTAAVSKAAEGVTRRTQNGKEASNAQVPAAATSGDEVITIDSDKESAGDKDPESIEDELGE